MTEWLSDADQRRRLGKFRSQTVDSQLGQVAHGPYGQRQEGLGAVERHYFQMLDSGAGTHARRRMLAASASLYLGIPKDEWRWVVRLFPEGAIQALDDGTAMLKAQSQQHLNTPAAMSLLDAGATLYLATLEAYSLGLTPEGMFHGHLSEGEVKESLTRLLCDCLSRSGMATSASGMHEEAVRKARFAVGLQEGSVGSEFSFAVIAGTGVVVPGQKKRAQAQNNLGMILLQAGRSAEASQAFQAAIGLYEASGDSRGMQQAQQNLSRC